MDPRLIRRDRIGEALAWGRANSRALAILAVLLVALAGFGALRAILVEVRLKDVRHALHAIPQAQIVAALALTALSYLSLTFSETLSLRAIGVHLPWRTAALASFTSYAISHNFGLTLLTGGSARYRVYASAGLDLGNVARVGLLSSAAFWAALLGVAALALLSGGAPIDIGGLVLPTMAGQAIGIAILALLTCLFVARLRGVEQVGIGRFTLPIPSASIMAAQLGVAAFDLAASYAALFVLLPNAAPETFAYFYLAYAVAVSVAAVSHVPGGIGVFEAIILAITPASNGAVFAALLLYRLIYYVLPLIVAAGLLASVEGHRLRRPIAIGLSLAERSARFLAPPLIGLLVFTGGLILLVSGALPAVHWRIHWLAHVVPLPFVEASHFAASMAGTALLLVAPAISARMRSGFLAARLLLAGGIIFSLLKGVDYEEATLLGVIAVILQYCRPAFYRRAGILDAPLQRTWFAAAAVAIGLSLWAGFFAYKRIPYNDDLWWAFAWKGNAPRFLRASMGAAVLLGAVACWRLLSAPIRPDGNASLPPEVADAALSLSSRADAALALTGDKQFLVSASGGAFLMYRVRGRTWVVMGDPVGQFADWSDLVWQIRGKCDAAHGRLCFYQASNELLPLLIEMGLQVMKYGDEAQVDLATFTLEGPASKSLRHSTRKAESAGLSFDIVPAAGVPAIVPELRTVSDAWLGDKGGHEKYFSVGRFDPAYLARFDCAVLRQEGRIVAFANIWTTRNRAELSVDLMRHLPDTPYGTMDLLFVRLMQWGAANGYTRFNLGMAPLSGLTGRRLAPLWSRIGHAIYGHGEALYGFSGLRSFKAKFQPAWVPRYVATMPGLATPWAMINLVGLIGG
ncbi:bifunctional lysylphosphatidylglycerol flippase/synthetase MprF [Sphingomonas sp. ERG5]|uniref:bifunctional lysylphosphatidylglycerol flippase/synthetase MprF n=1 Tax=Sphingomonas sp. ERG5 TaxID=1381597 RepID=UPI000A3EABA3|nr:bifunctional lysylphosphatidylglycerol flippase/synthetase MprF [Sphingomonas sp. ERG5]